MTTKKAKEYMDIIVRPTAQRQSVSTSFFGLHFLYYLYEFCHFNVAFNLSPLPCADILIISRLKICSNIKSTTFLNFNCRLFVCGKTNLDWCSVTPCVKIYHFIKTNLLLHNCQYEKMNDCWVEHAFIFSTQPVIQ